MAGQPPKYKTPEEMDPVIEEYFAEKCKVEYETNDDGSIKVTSTGKPVIKNLNAPSVTGLALHLGYESRQSFYDNEKREGFSYILKKARSKVEEWTYQNALAGKAHPGLSIFLLKQFGYTDIQEHSGNINHSLTVQFVKPDAD